MGRPRKNPEAGLPPRVYLRHGSFYYDHYSKEASPTGKRWERLGTDLEAAKKRVAIYEAGAMHFGTMGYWLKRWHIELKSRVAAKTLAERTRADYVTDTGPLTDFFGRMNPCAIEAKHIREYLDLGRDAKRPVRANREKAAFSACLTWMLERGHGGLTANVCRGVTRNPEKPRARYISDEEYLKVREHLRPAELLWSELIYRTLQRPSDILRWTKNNLIHDGNRLLLRFRQSKTRSMVSIIVTDTLKAAIELLQISRSGVKTLYLVSREDGKPYTETGIASMFRKATVAANIKDFAPYDLKAKGATDMYRAGESLERISLLCAHDSITTTETYIKARLEVAVSPNDRPLGSRQNTT